MKIIKLYIILELIISFPNKAGTKQLLDFNSKTVEFKVIEEPYSVGFWKRYKHNHKEMALKSQSKDWKKDTTITSKTLEHKWTEKDSNNVFIGVQEKFPPQQQDNYFIGIKE
jgi:hypothetical protein